MIALYLGLLLFGGLHLFSSLGRGARAGLIERFGEGPYKGLYSLISVLGLVLLGVGYWQTRLDGVLFYQAAPAARHATMLLVLVGFILMASMGGNGYLRKWTKNPFSIGAALWATGHLIANGKAPVVLIFGTILIISLADIAMSSTRGNAAITNPSAKRDLIAVVAGLAVYAVLLLGFHPYVLGVPILR